MDIVPNAQIREWCGVKKGLDERIDEGVLQLFGIVERMERDRIANRWIDTVKECLKKRGWMLGKQRERFRIGMNDRGL